jgi:hypothetical protein
MFLIGRSLAEEVFRWNSSCENIIIVSNIAVAITVDQYWRTRWSSSLLPCLRPFCYVQKQLVPLVATWDLSSQPTSPAIPLVRFPAMPQVRLPAMPQVRFPAMPQVRFQVIPQVRSLPTLPVLSLPTCPVRGLKFFNYIGRYLIK